MNTVILLIAIFLRQGCSVNTRFYPKYHIAPQKGWMNDPNGFSVFNGEYHLFYQYNPQSSHSPGTASWGHVKSKDLFHWKHLPIALYPDEDYDQDGVFSGSAIVEDGMMILYYTGNVNTNKKIKSSIQTQNVAISRDGVNFEKDVRNPILFGEGLQPHFRDPKVWKHDDTYYMVVGNSYANQTKGRVLLYALEHKFNWTNATVSILDKSIGSLGHMWECPDFFELDGKFVLLFSPQGIEPQGYLYKNLYQLGYLVGTFDYKTKMFQRLQNFKQIDFGYDAYASQTILDGRGRRIMVLWNDMWKRNYPEQEDGFEGQMAIPRTLHLKNNIIVQKPVDEIKSLYDKVLFSGKANSSTYVSITDRAAYIHIKTKIKEIKLTLQYGNNTSSSSESDASDQHQKFTIQYKRNFVTINRGDNDDTRKAKWDPKDRIIWDIYIDTSSVEVFCGEGEITFTNRVFYDGPVAVYLDGGSEVFMKITKMKQSVPLPSS